jgi:hypothetical protein
MALTLATAVRNAMCDAAVDQIDAGSGAGLLRIYTGSKPAGPGTAASGTLLAEFTLSDPAFGDAANGVATLDVTPDVQDASANATGTAGYFRLADSDGNGKIDGTVTATGGGGDITLNTVSIVSGAVVTITSGTITQPAGS